MQTTHTALLAEAQAAHEGDRAALLAAINEAANQLGGDKSKASQQGKSLMKESQVNRKVARDLVSNAGSARGDDLKSAADFDLTKAKLNGQSNRNDQESDLRSLPSEYDYGSKRKFLDVLGNISISQRIKQMRAQ